MANALQLRRGTTTQHNTFTGLAGEVTVDTDKETVVVHDGSTAGGFPLAKESDITAASLLTSIKTVDGAASGLDADTLDGKQLATIESEYQAFANTAAANVVDSAPGTLDTLNELAAALGDDANFSTTVTNSIATKMPLAGGTFTGDVSFGDNDKAIFGAGSDLQISHDGTHSFISESGTGELFIQGDSDVRITNAAGSEFKANFITNGAVDLYYDNSKKLATKTNGVIITGELASDSISLNDNAKANFGNSSDLQIYHDGNSKITDVGAGNLEITTDGIIKLQKGNTEYMAQFNVDGAVQLYYDNAVKIVTSATGADITGTLTTNGVTVDGTLDIEEVREFVQIDTNTGSSTFAVDSQARAIVYLTANQTANRTLNFTNVNSLLSTGQSYTASVLATQGSTAYYFNAYQVDGTAVTPKWSGGSAPTEGNASGIDVYTFTIIKTANATFTVLASQSQYA
jgi:hypothetical protein